MAFPAEEFGCAGSSVPAASAVLKTGHATQTHAIREREIRGTERLSSICRIRRARELPGIAMPAILSLTPDRLTERAMSMRYSEYVRRSYPRASTTLSQDSSAKAAR